VIGVLGAIAALICVQYRSNPALKGHSASLESQHCALSARTGGFRSSLWCPLAGESVFGRRESLSFKFSLTHTHTSFHHHHRPSSSARPLLLTDSAHSALTVQSKGRPLRMPLAYPVPQERHPEQQEWPSAIFVNLARTPHFKLVLAT
jgi:hypothetical protein